MNAFYKSSLVVFGCALILCGLAGCNALSSVPKVRMPNMSPEPVAAYKPTNVYKAEMPATLTRVAMLPMSAPADMGVKESMQSIQGVLLDELIKAKRFEVIPLAKDEMRQICGKESLSSVQKWPYELKEELLARQIDGVVLVELTHLRGYQPVAMGLKMRLVDLNTGKTLWAVDEMLDSANAAIYAGASQYEKGMVWGQSSTKRIASIQMSPSRFASYAGRLLFETLP